MGEQRAKGKWRRVTPEMRRQIMRLAAQGCSRREILSKVDSSMGAVNIVLRPLGGVVRKEMLERSGHRLRLEERVEIAIGLAEGRSYRQIGRHLGRSASTICREVSANGGRAAYKAVMADVRADRRARRPKATRLGANPQLCARVITDLEALWSPQQIARRLRQEAADGGSLGTVSHETIYKSLYIQGRGELRRELARCLRSGRAERKPRARIERRGRIANMVMISERPAEAEDRAVPGHWEGDLIVGKDGKSHVATLVERSTRYVMLAKIVDARAETVAAALAELIPRLPAHLWRSLTWDQGREMSRHEFFTVETGVPVYFCDPHSPWQRGSNENTNGLLRQYMPKGTDLSRHSKEDLDAIAQSLNGRPRKTLNWLNPSEKISEFFALTD